MKDADDPIPVDAISSRDALDIVYQAITPDWQLREERLNLSPPFHGPDDKVRANREAWHTYDEARWRANEWLRERISLGMLTALISDPDSKQVFKLDRHTGIASDLFEPHELLSRPNKIIQSKRPVFFGRKNFDNLVKEITQPDEVDRDNTSATATSKTKSNNQQLIRDVYMQLWPDGYKGRAKERNQKIWEKFERLGRTQPAVRSIQRALRSD